MKKATMLFAALIVAICGYSQISKNTVDTTKQWNIMIGGGIFADTYAYKIIGEDTVINNKLYYKIIRSDNYNTDLQEWYDWYDFDWIREDSNRVYVFTTHATDTNGEQGGIAICFKSTSDGHEYLLYDFNLKVGDSVTSVRENYLVDYYSIPLAGPFTVKRVDSVEINGVFCKRIEIINESGDKEEWTEGIGSNRGLLESLNLAHTLQCVHQNDNIIYGDNCYVKYGITDVFDITVSVYPNITNGILNFATDEFPLQIQFVNINGRTVRKTTVYNNTTFDVSDLTTGIYTLIISHNNQVITKKIIKL